MINDKQCRLKMSEFNSCYIRNNKKAFHEPINARQRNCKII